MGKKHRCDEFVHKGRVIAQFEVRHHQSNALRLFQEILGEGEEPRSQEGTIPDENKLFDVDLWKETNENCLFQMKRGYRVERMVQGQL